MEASKIKSIISSYVDKQVESLDSPILNFIKPVIRRILNNNMCKIDSFLDLIKDDKGNIDIAELITEMTESLAESKPFDYGIFHIGDSKISINILNQTITLTLEDIELLRTMFEEE